ncbi:MAG: hypothetical protein Q7S40_19605 [Opitutaceae bacterium]|nr:hypothetical protein [Opitutaceae bacterium]
MLLVAGTSLFAQTPPRPDDASRRRGGDDQSRRSFNPQEMQARMLAGVRDRLDVPNDEEWAVISDRIAKVFELRRTADTGGGIGGGFRGPPGGGGAPGSSGRSGTPGGGTPGSSGRGGSSRGGGSSNPDFQALQAAVTDKMPEAEIKLRIQRLRDTRLLNESKLAKAQEDLRAVLSVRQEAILVLLGLLR